MNATDNDTRAGIALLAFLMDDGHNPEHVEHILDMGDDRLAVALTAAVLASQEMRHARDMDAHRDRVQHLAAVAYVG